MMPLLSFAAAAVDLDTLDQAVARCDRRAVNRVCTSEPARRTQFLPGALVNDGMLAGQQPTLRETAGAKPSEQQQIEHQLELDQIAFHDQRRALSDGPMEGIGQDTMDNMRRYFFNSFAAGSTGGLR